jgi:hypothetical protein
VVELGAMRHDGTSSDELVSAVAKELGAGPTTELGF